MQTNPHILRHSVAAAVVCLLAGAFLTRDTFGAALCCFVPGMLVWALSEIGLAQLNTRKPPPNP
mgnify:FL=1